jgi:hypothetical protein
MRNAPDSAGNHAQPDSEFFQNNFFYVFDVAAHRGSCRLRVVALNGSQNAAMTCQ